MNNMYKADLTKATKEKTYYALAMFPYPSGAGLHVGHGTNFTANDIIARFKRMQGFTVINPIGWDSFGLPTENYAMKLGKPASDVTAENIANYKKQCAMMDWSYDWDREVATSSPEYYKWTQWIFQQLFKAGLVYKKDAYVNRCPTDQTVLANDQVVDGCCERCGTEIIQKKHPQWFIKITDYAEKLINDLDLIDWPEETKLQQKYWIGKSEGAEIDFTLVGEIIHPLTNVLILHGFHDDANTGWRKKLTDACIECDIPCYNPQFDHENGVSLEKDIESVIAQYGDKINKHTIIVGYSLGGMTAKHLIMKLGHKIDKLITVASSFSRPAYGDDAKEVELIAYRDTPVNYEKINTLVGEHKAYFSKDDPAIEYDLAIQHRTTHYPTADIHTFLNKGHFNKHFGVTEIPELLFDIGIENTKITVFTTRPDTLFGVTALVLAPENASIDAYIPQEYSAALEEYRKVTSKKTSVERQQDAETKSGVFSGCYAIHPLTQKEVPIWFADYVLPDYATGAVMFVPAHDERDDAFAYKHNIPVIIVIQEPGKDMNDVCYTGEGLLINSGEFDGMKNTDAKKAITEHLEKLGLGKKKITYKLRDWSVSRQRYWGSPIPVYYDEAGNPQLIPEDELPVVLPLDLGNYKPAGKSPLADHPTFPHYTAKDGKTYLRECDTLDTFMCSSFYYLRFVDPTNTKELISKEFADKALPVDFYIGGKEHTYGHLLYARFIHKFLFDQGYVSCPEPFQKLFHQGMILGPDGRKMSKRWGNVITPEDLVKKYGEASGTDVLRTYTMFMGPLEVEKAWNDNAVDGVKRFLDRVERMQDFLSSDAARPETDVQLHKTIKGVTEDIEKLKFNTAVSKMMVFVNHIYEVKAITKDQLATFLQLLAPFATKLAQEMRSKLSREGSIHLSQWPQFDENMIAEDTLSLPVQIGGKMRGTLDIKKGLSQDDVMELVHADDRFAKYLDGATIKKIIYVQDKIVNVII